MKTLLLALMLVPSIALADSTDDLIRAYTNAAAQTDPGDPAFDAGPNPQAAEAAVIYNRAFNDYLRGQAINNRTNLISPPDVHINAGDDLGTMQLKRTWQQQDAFGRAVTSSALEALQPSQQRGRVDYNQYFGQ